ncbi:MAG: hypothetical protein GX371_11755 [Bacteroidales bacterium]|nr:hypothetical protein [Bacteroidales bacterium]
MKTKHSFLIVLALVCLSSCAPKVYYQVYKATPVEQLVVEEDALVYEDENCEVVYNLWAEGGNIGFSFFNKTDQNIYLDKAASFFILNGIAYDYYKDRTFTTSSAFGSTTSRGRSASASVTGFNFFDLLQTNRVQAGKRVDLMNSSGSSVSYNEQKVVCIPPHTQKYIYEYKITDALYRDCNLFRYPKKNQVRTQRFYINDSPLVFSNRLAYTVGISDELIEFENEFYVSEISNYPRREITVEEYTEFCGEKSEIKTTLFKDASADKFYITYTKEFGKMKH